MSEIGPTNAALLEVERLKTELSAAQAETEKWKNHWLMLGDFKSNKYARTNIDLEQKISSLESCLAVAMGALKNINNGEGCVQEYVGRNKCPHCVADKAIKEIEG